VRGLYSETDTASERRRPESLLEDIDVRINEADGDAEATLWSRVRDDIKRLVEMSPRDPEIITLVRHADSQLRKLRVHYDNLVTSSVAIMTDRAYNRELVVVTFVLISATLYALVTLLIRDWLVKPVQVLTDAANQIGAGHLDHRVPLDGNDELGQLARRIDWMAEHLQHHQTQLVESSALAAIGELCSNVAHGFRNPLAGIRASAQLAGRKLDKPDELRPMLNDVLQEVDRLDQRIVDLFEFSRIRTRTKRPTLFSQLIDDSQVEAKGALDLKHARLEVTDETDGVEWPVDRERIAGVVAEIVSNAVHHSDDGATISLRGSIGRCDGDGSESLTIVIADQGCGIASSSLPHVFDLFYTSRPSGTGMGLALARRIVEQHGGDISVESDGVSGTQVTITLTR